MENSLIEIAKSDGANTTNVAVVEESEQQPTYTGQQG